MPREPPQEPSLQQTPTTLTPLRKQDADQETGRMGRIRPPVGGDLRPYCQILLTLAYSPNTGMKV